MNNLIKIIFAGAAAIVAGKTVSNAAKEHADETMRNKEAPEICNPRAKARKITNNIRS